MAYRDIAKNAPVNVQGKLGSAQRTRFEKVRKKAIASLKKQFHNRPGIPGFMTEERMEKFSDFRLLKGDSKDLKKFKMLVREEMAKIDPSLFDPRLKLHDPKFKAVLTRLSAQGLNSASLAGNIKGNIRKAAIAKVKR